MNYLRGRAHCQRSCFPDTHKSGYMKCTAYIATLRDTNYRQHIFIYKEMPLVIVAQNNSPSLRGHTVSLCIYYSNARSTQKQGKFWLPEYKLLCTLSS